MIQVSKIVEYLIFVSCTIIILLITLDRNLFLLAPPYAVTAYLMIFERRVKFSKTSSVLVSYIAVIVVTTILHFAFGRSEFSLALSIILMSAFISFTKFSHPPVIALAIFSYYTDNIFSFIITTLVILAIIFLFTALTRFIIPSN